MQNPHPSNVIIRVVIAIALLFAFFAVGVLIYHLSRSTDNEEELRLYEKQYALALIEVTT